MCENQQKPDRSNEELLELLGLAHDAIRLKDGQIRNYEARIKEYKDMLLQAVDELLEHVTIEAEKKSSVCVKTFDNCGGYGRIPKEPENREPGNVE